MTSMTSTIDEPRRLDARTGINLPVVLFLAALIVVGLWLRLRNLGALSLFVDEGVQALAVKGIQEHGVPLMDSGLMYTRAPLYLFTQAWLVDLLGFSEFSLRLPSVIWGILGIVVTYLLAKQLYSRPVALISALMIALSSWQIEMSRYARVYIALQFFFVLALLFFYRGFIFDQDRYKPWFLGVALLAFLTHELGQVLLVLFALPLLLPSTTWQRKLVACGWGAASVVVLFLQQRLTGLIGSGSTPWPDEEIAASGGVLQKVAAAVGLPFVLEPDLGVFSWALDHAVWLPLLVVAIAVATLIYLKVTGRLGGVRIPLYVAVLVLGVIQQFGLALILLLLVVVVNSRAHANGHRGAALILAAGLAGMLLVWCLGAALAPDRGLVTSMFAFFGYPNIYQYMIRWLIKGWPVLTLIAGIGVIKILLDYRQGEDAPKAIFVLGAILLPALFAGLFESHFVPVYFLHLFPLIVILFAMTAWWAIRLMLDRTSLPPRYRNGVVAVACVVLLFASVDAAPGEAWAVGSRTYQTKKHPVRNIMTYWVYADFHQDYKGACSFVRENAREGDELLVLGMDHGSQLCHVYSGKVDYIATSPENVAQFGVNAGGGIIHYTTGARFITDETQLRRLASDDSRTLWVVSDRRVLRRGHPIVGVEPMKDLVRDWAQAPMYGARDNITFVVRATASDD